MKSAISKYGYIFFRNIYILSIIKFNNIKSSRIEIKQYVNVLCDSTVWYLQLQSDGKNRFIL